jgi:tetratricopeptide (TPR) repeat protein
VKVLQRHAVMAAGLLSLAAGISGVAEAQRGQQPGQDTPRILIATFRSVSDPAIGVQSAEAIRTRVQQENPVRQLWVLSRKDINTYLSSSGYKEDSTLSLTDLKELAKLMRADEILDGSATKTPNGVRIDAKLILSKNLQLVQPLPSVEAKNAGDAAKEFEKNLREARKSLESYRKCENALRDEKYDEAIAAGRAAIQQYPQSTLGRLCIMSAYSYGKKGADSVISAANEVLTLDSTSTLALSNLVEAYKAKNDTTHSIEALLKLAKYQPDVRQQAVQMLGAMGKPDVALPFVQQMLQDNPGDPELLRMNWLLLLSSQKWKEALAAGQDYVKADSAAANADYFTRSIAAALSDSQPQVASQIAARAVQKFPNDAGLWNMYAQTQRKAGQLEQAVATMKRALEIDPKTENGWLFVTVTQVELKQMDSALASAKQAIAAGADKETIGQALLVPAGAAMKAAQEANTRESWTTAYHAVSAIDSVAPSVNTQYFVGVSAFQVGLQALQAAQKSKSCADVTETDDMWTQAQIMMPQIAAVSKETAGQLMPIIQQYSPNVQQAKKAYCK